jgi:aspartyl-tRNA(Asn)/glutamyl-tRNA(Gln) amidotransferase subunit C
MKLSPEQLAHLTKLSALSEDDAKSLGEEVSRIIDLIDKLRSLDTKDTAPLAHPLDIVQALRSDEVGESDNTQALSEMAPMVEENVYLVPKVLESE